MVFLDLYTLPNATSGIDDIAIQTLTSVPSFTPLLLLFVFFLIFLTGTGRQKARTGNADFPQWAVVSSIATLMVALILSTVTGLIQLDYLVIVVVITIFSGVWFFLDQKQSEV
jgi:uncharacterized membrane protein YjjP (DUF1212 family)